MQMRGLQGSLAVLPGGGCHHEQADRTAGVVGIPAVYATGAVFSLQRIQCGILLAFVAASSAAVGCLVLSSTTRRRTPTSGIAVRSTAVHATRAVFAFQRSQCGLRLAFAAARAAGLGCHVLTSTTRRRTPTSAIAVRINSKTTRTTTTCKPFLTCCKSTSTPITLAVAG